RTLRGLEGRLRGLDREMTQTEVVRAVNAELGQTISQSYLSLIENGTRPHLSQSSRQLLAAFFKVHPGYLVNDPPGFHTELTSELRTVEARLDRWLLEGAEHFSADPDLREALSKLARAEDSRGCLLLLSRLVNAPDLVVRLMDA